MYIVVLKQDLWCPQLKLEPTVTASFSTSGVILSILEGIAAFPFPVVFITFLKFLRETETHSTKQQHGSLTLQLTYWWIRCNVSDPFDALWSFFCVGLIPYIFCFTHIREIGHHVHMYLYIRYLHFFFLEEREKLLIQKKVGKNSSFFCFVFLSGTHPFHN